MGEANLCLPVAEGRYLNSEASTGSPASNDHSADSSDPAFLFYTSGSTGIPKGVILPHRAITFDILRQTHDLAINRSDRFDLLFPFCFSAFLAPTFGALLNGASLHVLDTRSRLHRLPMWLLQQRITVSTMTVTTLRELCRLVSRSGQWSELRLVSVGGESLEASDVRTFWSTVSQRCLVQNALASTETRTIAQHFLLPGQSLEDGPVPVGWAVDDRELILENEAGREVPVGSQGEVVIRSHTIADGYWNRSTLQAERFHRLSDGRMEFRSGDLARFRDDGALVHTGRADRQIKVRGQRVEIGEIESTLQCHDNVRAAVVVAKKGRPGGQRLIAYVVARLPQATCEQELRSFLETRLPAYMLPEHFVLMDSLPLTSNGKVDRLALPALSQRRPDADQPYQKPRTEIERRLTAILENRLGLRPVGIHDAYSELGGDSLLGMSIVADARRAGFRLTPQQLSEHPTVAELACVIEAEGVDRPGQTEVAHGAMPLTPGLRRFLSERESPDLHYWNVSLLLETPRSLNRVLLGRAFRVLFSHHDGLRLRLPREHSGWSPKISGPTDDVPFEQHDLSNLPEPVRTKRFEELILRLQGSFDLGRGPLVRLVHLDLGSAGHRMLFQSHHCVVDGVSLAILLEDLETAYMQLSRGEQVSLPPRTTSLKRWAERLTEYGQSDELRNQAHYWISRPWSHVRPIPYDFPWTPGGNSNASAREIRVSLGAKATKSLLKSAAALKCSTEDLLAAVLACSMGEWTRYRVVLLDRIGNGRVAFARDIDLSRTVGFFLSYTPLVLRVPSGNEHGRLEKVLSDIQLAKANELSFDLLRETNHGADESSHLSAAPRSQVSFNFRGRINEVISPDSLFSMAPEDIEASNHSPLGLRSYPLSVVSDLGSNGLDIRFVYTNSMHREATVKELAKDYVRRLSTLAITPQGLCQIGS